MNLTKFQKETAINIIINTFREQLKDFNLTLNEIDIILEETKEAYRNFPINH